MTTAQKQKEWYRTFRYQQRYTALQAWRMAIEQSKYHAELPDVLTIQGHEQESGESDIQQ